MPTLLKKDLMSVQTSSSVSQFEFVTKGKKINVMKFDLFVKSFAVHYDHHIYILNN